MRETATRPASVGSEQTLGRPPQASSHGGTFYSLAECSRLERENHEFSTRQYAEGPCPNSPSSHASGNTQALPASVATSPLQHDEERSEAPVRQGLDYLKMDKNTRWQTNSTYQSTADSDEIKDEKQAHKSKSQPRGVGHPGPTVLWIEDEFPEDSKQEQYTSRILVHLSFLSPFLALMICIYTIFILATLIMLIPLYLCTTRKPFRQQISDLLLPAIHLQLRLIYSPYDTTSSACTLMLALVSVLSPIYAAAIAVAAWVAASFWAYAGILGDPDGLGQSHDDGRTAVLRVRGWWERWLQRALSRRGSDQSI